MTRIYKLIDRPSWEAALAASRFDGSPIDLTDGFIHFSTAAQAAETARRYFRHQHDLLILTVETAALPLALAEALKWEPSRGGDLFPHLYAPLDPQLVIATHALALDADGYPIVGRLQR